MANLDVECLFTNIQLEKTFKVCCGSLFGNDAKVNNVNRINFKKLLGAALQNCFFNFEGKNYKLIDGVAIGSPLGPTLGNVFLCFHEQIWLKECLHEFKSAYYRRLIKYLFSLVYQIILRNLKTI